MGPNFPRICTWMWAPIPLLLLQAGNACNTEIQHGEASEAAKHYKLISLKEKLWRALANCSGVVLTVIPLILGFLVGKRTVCVSPLLLMATRYTESIGSASWRDWWISLLLVCYAQPSGLLNLSSSNNLLKTWCITQTPSLHAYSIVEGCGNKTKSSKMCLNLKK